ncbi:MAG: hypothetical protein HQM16_17830 [Deltaproteobacteria bacterium]|nr:hypothetical protein [Deltaproteobacteria bacterium]
MKIKNIIDSALVKGEKLTTDVLNELFKSKTIQDLVTNKNFVNAVTKIMATKEEAKKVISKQVKTIFDVMDVPTKAELKKIASKIGGLEKIIDTVGRKKIAVSVLKKSKKVSRSVKKRPQKKAH